jgi:A/G-specific adenine glycosylase
VLQSDLTSTMPSTNQTEKIQKSLLAWFKKSGRDLPWRKTRDPYAIWVSEIMLQQTQVSTVIPYYQKFLKVFPTVRRLAKADLSKVLSIWEGLGYYSRARNLHKASRVILERFNGKIPDTLNDLLSIPGIGRYTAGAILSIAYNREAAILDGNVKRVLSRLFAVSDNPVRGKTVDLLWNYSKSLIPEGRAGSFNQALMDLGATLCTPKDPQCARCPLRRLCKGYESGNPGRFPSKGPKKAIPLIQAVSAVIQKDGQVLLRQRPPEGLLGGLWEFPNWGVDHRKGSELKLPRFVKNELGIRIKTEESLGSFKHTYSHFKLTLHVYLCQAAGSQNVGTWVPLRNLRLFPMSRLHRRIAQTLEDNSHEGCFGKNN